MPDAAANLKAAERVAGLLRAQGFDALVIGAVALAAHHYIRHTEDIDLGVDVDLADLRTLTTLLRAAGFEADLHEPGADDPLGGVIDVAGPFGLVQIVSFAGRFPAVIHDAMAASDLRVRPGSELRLVPLPHLVALKLYAGGPKSRADIVELIHRNPTADLAEIRETCRRYRLTGLDALLDELDDERP